MNRLTRRGWPIAACVVLAVAIAAGSDSSELPVPPTLTWASCSEPSLQALECANFIVPKDYTSTVKGYFPLAVVRAKATGSATDRIGTLFFNPGGPGESGVTLAPVVVAALPAELRKHFDFVTWDPRGVARSAGLNDCSGGNYTLPPTGPVDWQGVVDSMRASEKAANEACAVKYTDVVPYISTNSTVRDLDRLREALGDSKLTYWGTSYGTRIGYVYAHDYPDRVRAMLLSSPISPNATWGSFAYGAAQAPDDATNFFFQIYPGVRERYDRVIASINTRPLLLPSGANVTHWDVRAAVASEVKSQSAYREIAALLDALDTAINGPVSAKSQAKATLDLMEWKTTYPINGAATAFIGCLDYPQRLSRDEQIRLSEQIRTNAPVFGFGASQGLFFCDGIHVKPDPVPVNFENTQTPILIIGSTHDGLTPYQWATEISNNFANSRVVTYDGTQHTAFLTTGSTCVDTPGLDFLIRGIQPTANVICPYSDSPQ